jgi:hypothetical protein
MGLYIAKQYIEDIDNDNELKKVEQIPVYFDKVTEYLSLRVGSKVTFPKYEELEIQFLSKGRQNYIELIHNKMDQLIMNVDESILHIQLIENNRVSVMRQVVEYPWSENIKGIAISRGKTLDDTSDDFRKNYMAFRD